MKKIIFLFCFFLSFMITINADCTYSDISRLKGYASNINISYDYRIENNTVYFKTTINNLTPELYMVDNATNKKYFYSDSNNGELIIDNYTNVTKDKYVIYASTSNCEDKRLLTKYYSFPQYNIYYESQECQGIQNFYLCKKWVSEGTSFNKFYEIVEEYKNSKNVIEEEDEQQKIIIEKSLLDKILEFYAKNYYYILIPITIICLIIILYQRKKDNFDL